MLKKHVLSFAAMELLKTGCQYDLLASSASSGNVSVLHVKLTDAALKAVEEYHEWTRKLKVIMLRAIYQSAEFSKCAAQFRNRASCKFMTQTWP